jgi:hypothetical protein
MAETFQNHAKRIERTKAAYSRTGVGRTHFLENFVLTDPNDPHVSGVVRTDGSPIPRLKPVPLGACAVGFASADIDALIEALRDAKRKDGWPRRTKAKTTAPPSRPVTRARAVRR